MTKQAADLHTASFNQYVAYEVGKGGFLDEHVKVHPLRCTRNAAT